MDTNQEFTQPSEDFGEVGPDREVGLRVKGEKLYNDLEVLIRSEMKLVRSEIREKVHDLRKGSISIGIGISLLFLSLFSLMATFILVLGMFIPWWTAALGVTVLFALVGFALFRGGKEKIEIDELRPRHSIEALNEMKKIVKENYYEFKSGPKQ